MSITGREWLNVLLRLWHLSSSNTVACSLLTPTAFVPCVSVLSLWSCEFTQALFIWSVRYVKTFTLTETLTHINKNMLSKYTSSTESNQLMMPFHCCTWRGKVIKYTELSKKSWIKQHEVAAVNSRACFLLCEFCHISPNTRAEVIFMVKEKHIFYQVALLQVNNDPVFRHIQCGHPPHTHNTQKHKKWKEVKPSRYWAGILWELWRWDPER